MGGVNHGVNLIRSSRYSDRPTFHKKKLCLRLTAENQKNLTKLQNKEFNKARFNKAFTVFLHKFTKAQKRFGGVWYEWPQLWWQDLGGMTGGREVAGPPAQELS